MTRAEPESRIATAVVPSPNHGERFGGPPDMLILHYTGMDTAAAALQRLLTAGAVDQGTDLVGEGHGCS